MSFKKNPPQFSMSSSGDIVTKKLVQVETNGRIQTNLVDTSFDDAYETELEASNFSLERELNAGINLTEQNSLLLDSEPTVSQLSTIDKLITEPSNN